MTAARPPRMSRWTIALIILAGALFVGIFALLVTTAAWPADCTPRRPRSLDLFWCSPALLRGGWKEFLLFAIIWGAPIGAALFFRRLWRRL